MGMVFTDANALAASNTFLGKERDDLRCIHPFGIVTPDAAQRAAFEENGRADAGPVVDGETLDVENASYEPASGRRILRCGFSLFSLWHEGSCRGNTGARP
jgi:hypothetical protein